MCVFLKIHRLRENVRLYSLVDLEVVPSSNDYIFLDSIQFSGKFNKIMCREGWRPLLESWIRHCYLKRMIPHLGFTWCLNRFLPRRVSATRCTTRAARRRFRTLRVRSSWSDAHFFTCTTLSSRACCLLW